MRIPELQCRLFTSMSFTSFSDELIFVLFFFFNILGQSLLRLKNLFKIIPRINGYGKERKAKIIEIR